MIYYNKIAPLKGGLTFTHFLKHDIISINLLDCLRCVVFIVGEHWFVNQAETTGGIFCAAGQQQQD